ncbi:hypothetical protein GX51_02530 [Blastomyces parvus]|uniref:Rhodopsin domain-containing protein n=1 Tax=Blastomyces parvus TaxID=2060905 RepID=A0A2B7XBN2_9EURO|nr:hypothetical protein GX51_02530 [Blastomyces parvus]
MSDSEWALAVPMPARDVGEYNVELWTQYGFGVLITILRTYVRVKAVGFRNLQADDYLIWFAILLFSAQTTLTSLIVINGRGLANNAMTDAERAALDPTFEEYQWRAFGSKVQVICWTCYACLICTLKMAMLVFYTRLLGGLSRRYSIRIWFGFGLVATTFLASVISIYAGCRPLSKYWQINPNPGNGCQAGVSRPVVFSTFTASVLTDVYLIMIPLPVLWGTRLKLAKKIGATVVLGAGIFVLVCATVKTICVEVDTAHGAELAGKWGTRETFVSVITTNLPMMFPFVRMIQRPMLGSAVAASPTQSRHPVSFRTSNRSGGGGYSDDSHKYSSHTCHGLKASSNNKHATNATLPLTESEEQIVQDVRLQNVNVSAEVSTAGPQQQQQQQSRDIVVSREFHVTEERAGRNRIWNHGIVYV